MGDEIQLPAWAEQLRVRYISGESSLFLLHGNVRDLYPWIAEGGILQYLDMQQFLSRFLGRSKDAVLYYNVSDGVQIVGAAQRTQLMQKVNVGRQMDGMESLNRFPKGTDEVLPLVERIITNRDANAAVILDYLETIIPVGDLSFMSESEKGNLVRLQRWTSNSSLLGSDNIVIMVTENLADVPRRLLGCAQLAVVEVGRPTEGDRVSYVQRCDLSEVSFAEGMTGDRFGAVCAGLNLVQIRGLLRRARQVDEPVDFRLVNSRKKQIIEQECHGLVEFVAPNHDFSHVGGNDALKEELMRVADAIRAGRTNQVPMGMLFVGPMGTGKTFIAEAFAGESGLTCIKFKNFREKWVGSTEGNLEKILQVIHSLGYVLLIIDEADRSMSSGTDGDGGTSSRVIARIKEFMSDTRHRGRIVVLMMTNRPDKIDIDLKRPGRLDTKIPFFFPQDTATRNAVLNALIRKNKIAIESGTEVDCIGPDTEGYSAAELEAVMLRAMRIAAENDREALIESDLEMAAADVIPSRDQRMLSYMEMLAVFESSSRKMIPEKYRHLGTEEVLSRLDTLRAQLYQERRG